MARLSHPVFDAITPLRAQSKARGSSRGPAPMARAITKAASITAMHKSTVIVPPILIMRRIPLL